MSQFILYAHDVDDINDNDHDADVDKLDYQANWPIGQAGY